MIKPEGEEIRRVELGYHRQAELCSEQHFPPFSTLPATSICARRTIIIAGKSWEERKAVTVSWRIVRNITIQPKSIDRQRLLCKTNLETFRGTGGFRPLCLLGVAWDISLKIRSFPHGSTEAEVLTGSSGCEQDLQGTHPRHPFNHKHANPTLGLIAETLAGSSSRREQDLQGTRHQSLSITEMSAQSCSDWRPKKGWGLEGDDHELIFIASSDPD
ncbi:MAG: hypothetical protein Q9212_004717 [Teloschistes hypoglaucus]